MYFFRDTHSFRHVFLWALEHSWAWFTEAVNTSQIPAHYFPLQRSIQNMPSLISVFIDLTEALRNTVFGNLHLHTNL